MKKVSTDQILRGLCKFIMMNASYQNATMEQILIGAGGKDIYEMPVVKAMRESVSKMAFDLSDLIDPTPGVQSDN